LHQSFFAFLHNRDIAENGGVFVTRARSLASVVPKGSVAKTSMDTTKMNPAMTGGAGGMVGSMMGRGPRDRLVGVHVTIVRGPNKGYIGIVKDTNGPFARVEVSSKNKIITIEKDKLRRRKCVLRPRCTLLSADDSPPQRRREPRAPRYISRPLVRCACPAATVGRLHARPVRRRRDTGMGHCGAHAEPVRGREDTGVERRLGNARLGRQRAHAEPVRGRRREDPRVGPNRAHAESVHRRWREDPRLAGREYAEPVQRVWRRERGPYARLGVAVRGCGRQQCVG
jgi:hypothetical protein